MNRRKRLDAVKAFSMTNMLLEADLDDVEKKYEIDLGRKQLRDRAIDGAYYSQFDEALRQEARAMSEHYELFYCLERSIRRLIVDVIEANEIEDWWETLVPEHIKTNVKRSIKREREAAITARSIDSIDYTTFGELSEIIKSNRPIFGGVFNDIKAVEKVLGSLNSIRNPIAHCAPLAEDEVLRLELSLRDWFRMMT